MIFTFLLMVYIFLTYFGTAHINFTTSNKALGKQRGVLPLLSSSLTLQKFPLRWAAPSPLHCHHPGCPRAPQNCESMVICTAVCLLPGQGSPAGRPPCTAHCVPAEPCTAAPSLLSPVLGLLGTWALTVSTACSH